MKNLRTHRVLFHYGTLALAALIPLSMRMVTGCLILLAVNWLLAGGLNRRLREGGRDPLLLLCVLFYLWELSGLLYTNHLHEGFYHAQREASFLVIPLIYLAGTGRPSAALRSRAMKVFCLSVLLASLYCIALGSIHYLHTGDSSFLFYHKLVAPLHQHAVYFSLYVFICIAFLADRLKRPVPVGKGVPAMLLIVFFCFLLFLLRSKMVVGFTTLYAVVQLAQSAIRQRKVLKPGFAFNLVVILAVPLALFTANPFSREVGKIKESDIRVLDRQQFDPDQYFDEVQLRLLLWKFSLEVLDSTHDWWAGVSPGDAKFRINEKIVGAHMYTGEPGTADTGFLNYNLHNQYLETLLRSGLAGLILLLAILYVILRAALSAGDEVLLATLLSFAAVFLTESVLERQMGIVPFFFFVCLLHTAKKGGRQGYLKQTADERQA